MNLKLWYNTFLTTRSLLSYLKIMENENVHLKPYKRNENNNSTLFEI